MRKQTKLVAVLSAAALLAIGASMTSFAATGWQEENGTWVYYDRSGDLVTDKWAKSGNNWFYLDGSGEMAVDQLVEDDDDYYYVDANGAMVTNRWVAVDNEDGGGDNEPDQWWYYFQNNGKAMKGPSDGKISLKTINGKKYAFTDDAKMLYGWIKEDDQTIINDDDDAWKEGEYYFGDEDDGAMTVGWKLLDITDDSADSDKWINTAFSDDEDQSRWFYFKTNGKKTKATTSDDIKEKTINGVKYGFDEYGRMVAEWSIDTDKGTTDSAYASSPSSSQTRAWKYYGSVESGAKVAKGWFKVVAAENLNKDKYDDDEEKWYFADNNGHLYANEFKTIKGKKYGFNEYGIMLDGMHFISGPTDDFADIKNDDDDTYPFDTDDNFNENAAALTALGYRCYYFGDGNDGAMKIGSTTVTIDGEKFNFNFAKSGAYKGAGKTEVDDKKFYNAGKLVTAGKDEKYQVVRSVAKKEVDTIFEVATGVTTGDDVVGYKKYDDAQQFVNAIKKEKAWYYVLDLDDIKDMFADGTGYTNASRTFVDEKDKSKTVSFKLSDIGLTSSKLKDDKYNSSDFAVFIAKNKSGLSLGLPKASEVWGGYSVVNTSGKMSESGTKNKDGNDVYYKLDGGRIVSAFSED